MSYFNPSLVADMSVLKRFGSRARTVVCRCSRTGLCGEEVPGCTDVFYSSSVSVLGLGAAPGAEP
jgi:hypothetical protein